MESMQSRLLKLFLRTVKLNKMWKLTGEELRKSVLEKQKSESPEPPKSFVGRYNVTRKETPLGGCYQMKPLGMVGKKHILYLHGGGYVYGISSIHWEFLGKLADALDCTITVPLYPLAPEYNHQEVFQMLLPIYEEVCTGINQEDLVLMGDSAGGGIALALAQLLKQMHLPQPGNIILLSPVLDMTFSNPEIVDMEGCDLIVATPALRDIAQWYRGGREIAHPLVSPIYGDLEGLGEVSLFIGTHEVLCPDARRLKKMMDEKRISIGYYEYPGMLHVWPLFFLPESKKAVSEIIEIIRG